METTAVQSARERIGQVQEAPTTHDNTPRFFVQFGREVLDTDCAGIPGKVLRRGDITPLLGYQRVAHINTIPEGSIVAGSQMTDKDGRPVYAKEIIYAGPEADRLVDLELNAGDRKDGLWEVKALRGRLADWQALDFNLILFPDGIPEKHADTLELLKVKQAELTAKMHASVPSHLGALVLEVVKEFIGAVEAVDKIHHDRIELTHRQMKLSPDDGSGMYKKGYDPVDEEILKRTGKPRFDAAADQTARALELLSKNSTAGSSGDNAILAALVEQNERLARALEMLAARDAEPKQQRRSPFTDKN